MTSLKERLINWINDTYGSPEEFSKTLDLCIEMLFYLEEDSFEAKEVREVVVALRGVINILRC